MGEADDVGGADDVGDAEYVRQRDLRRRLRGRRGEPLCAGRLRRTAGVGVDTEHGFDSLRVS